MPICGSLAWQASLACLGFHLGSLLLMHILLMTAHKLFGAMRLFFLLFLRGYIILCKQRANLHRSGVPRPMHYVLILLTL